MDKSKYCSQSCRQKFRFKSGEYSMARLWEKSCTVESNAKKGHRLEKNHKWITDRTKVIGRRRSECRVLFEQPVFERDRFSCVECGSKDDIVADHIKPFVTHPELYLDPDNGRTLCEPCHRKTLTYGMTKKEAIILDLLPLIRSMLIFGNKPKEISCFCNISTHSVYKLIRGGYKRAKL